MTAAPVVAGVLAFQIAAIAAGLALAADIYAHKRTQLVGGVNMWGYRGPVARARQPGEVRIVFVGGTRAFGWGATVTETIPATVRWMIMLATDLPGRPLRPVVDINLARIGAHAATYAESLRRHADLQPDYVCIYDDLGAPAPPPPSSRTQRITGYEPALPLVLQEKAMLWRYGSVAAGYHTDPVVPPAGAHPVAGSLLQAAGSALAALDRAAAPPDGAYPDSMMEAVREARAQARRVLVVVGPAITPDQRMRLEALRQRLARLAPESDRVRLLELGDDTLREPSLLLDDGYSYNGEGRRRVAAAIAPVLIEWIQQAVD